MTWCKSARLMDSWAYDQSQLIGVETQRLYPTVICWLNSGLEQTIVYVTVQTADPFPRSFISWTGWNNQKFWTTNAQNLSALQEFPSFSQKCKYHFLQSRPKILSIFSAKAWEILSEKTAKQKKTSRGNLPKSSSIDLSEKNHLKTKKPRSHIRKRFTTHKSNNSSHY